MPQRRFAAGASAILALAGFSLIEWTGAQGPPDSFRPMSFHNRLLFNRAAVTGLQSIEVMLLVAPAATGVVSTRVTAFGGRVRKTDRAVGYMRVEIPTVRLLELVASESIAAYQIASLSRGSWYRDGPPMSNAQMYRGFEVSAPGAGASEGNPRYASLPVLSPSASREIGYAGDDDVGITEWMKAHPTFDGRGVTIALLESAQPAFLDATLGPALTVDGREVPKIAGILNTIDPEQPDATRVPLDTQVHAATAWVRIGDRTFVVPRAGKYRFGMFTLPAGANLVHQFGVIQHEETGELWVDANGNADFQDETPVADITERFDPRVLKLTHPRALDLSFVLGRGRSPNIVHIYTALGSHLAMTLSVAAGSMTKNSLAFGVAPNARVLLVRNASSGYALADMVESFVEAAQRPDVDIVNASAGLDVVPDTAADFVGLLFQRVMGIYDKPIIDAAGNRQLWLNSASARGDMMSVGGSMGPRAFAALYGGEVLDSLIVHPFGAGGPALDGGIKPDFLAPMERLAADLPWNTGIGALPVNAPAYRISPGYQVSCCTSASSPYAAGVAALLVSGAKQERLPHSRERLARAMRIGSRFLPGFQSYEQGNGVLDLNAAWQELIRPLDIPRILARADVVHPLAQYAANGSKGQGILEFEGWKAGMTARREIQLRRESGPRDPVTYRLTWTGSDGTFRSAESVTLPLGATVGVSVTVNASVAGAHSALLNVHDPFTDRIVFRTQATIVAAERINPSTGMARMAGKVRLMRTAAHFVHVPAGVSAISIELEVGRGVLRTAILPAHGLYPNYYNHLHPGTTRMFGRGKYRVTLPDPAAGTWGIYLTNDSLTLPIDRTLASGMEAEYALSVHLGNASLTSGRSGDGSIVVNVQNLGSLLREPIVDVSAATLKTRRGEFLANGFPNIFDIAVPSGASTLALDLRAVEAGRLVELYLYDCTSGECFSYDIGFPAGSSQKMVVRQPSAGRWIAVVNAAPFPVTRGGFVLEEIIATGKASRSAGAAQPRPTGARWIEVMKDVPIPAPADGRTRVLFVELLDLAVEREASSRSWDPRPIATKLRNQPIGFGLFVHPLEQRIQSPR